VIITLDRVLIHLTLHYNYITVCDIKQLITIRWAKRVTTSQLATVHKANTANKIKLECGPMSNVMAALPNIGGALCSTPHWLMPTTTVPCSNVEISRSAPN